MHGGAIIRACVSDSVQPDPDSDLSSRERSLITAARRDAMTLAADGRHNDGPIIECPGYQFVGEVHRGGQGVVYRAVQESTGRDVAIKVMRTTPLAGPDHVRFDREVWILSQLHHPNIVSVHDSGLAGNRVFLVMDYIEGEPLDVYVTRRELSLDAVLRLTAKVCDAVHAAHLRGVIHRDLKPGNIRIDEHGEPHILDFGLAKISDEASSMATPRDLATHTGQFIGSLPWASPEQAQGKPGQVDVRSDVYSLGVIAYQLFTHEFPYDVGGTSREVMDRILTAPPTRPSTFSRHINDDLETVLLKCLSKEPARRYQSAGDFSHDLQHCLAGEPVEAKRDSGWYTLRKTLQRHRMAVAATALAVILVAASAVTLAVMYRQQGRLLNDVRTEAAKAKAIGDFLSDMLGRIDPQHARGRDVTVLRELLDDASARVGQELAGQPAIEASLRRTIGNAYRSIGVFDQAEAHLRRALEIRQTLHDEPHTDVAVSLSDLAGVVADMGEHAQAQRLHEQSLGIYQSLKGSEHAYVAITLGNVANELRAQGENAEAERLYERSIELLRRGDEADRRDLAKALQNYAAHLLMQYRPAEAEPLLREAIAIQREVLSPDDPSVARTMHNLASMLEDKGDFTKAESTYKDTLALRRRILGDDHPEVAETLNNLGHMYQVRGDYAAAEPLFLEALAIRRARLGPNHPDLALSLHNLAAVFVGQGRLDEAEPLCREALAIERTQPGTRAALGDMLSGLAALLYFRRDYASAEQFFREALQVRQRLLGDAAPTAETMNSLAGVLKIRGDLPGAEALFRQALAIQRRVLPEAHPSMAAGLTGLGAVLTQTDRAAEALPLLREAFDIRRSRLVPGHWLTAVTASALGACLTALGQFDEGEQLLLDAYGNLQVERGQQDERTLAALDRLIALYQAWGKAEKASALESQRPPAASTPSLH